MKPYLELIIIGVFFLIFLALSGCSNLPKKPEVIEIDKPIAINCIKEKPIRPPYRTEKLGPSASDFEYADALANDWVLSRVYEDALEKAVDACLMK